MATKLGIRWTIGDVSERGFEALRLSVWGAYGIFGDQASYAVCVNSLPLAVAQARTRAVPELLRWVDANAALPHSLRPYFGSGMAQGTAWKLAPLRLFPELHELSLDNDCVLWALPAALSSWLADGGEAVLMAEDVRACCGSFANLCGGAPRNLGVRGLPPRFDLEHALLSVLRQHPGVLTSELDEQGLQLAALSRARRVHVVSLRDVSICSPFPPHLPDLGRAGAHFCGINCKQLSWDVDGRPAERVLEEHWQRQRATLNARVDRAVRGQDVLSPPTQTTEGWNSSNSIWRNSRASRAPYS